MVALEPPHRHARIADAEALAFLVNEAGEGMPLHLWCAIATDGEAPWAVGAARARREASAFSYRNAVVREHDGEVAACLIGYPLPEAPEPVDYATLPPMFAPLQQLEDLAGGSWYVNVLATRSHLRGLGYGAALLDIAVAQARATGRRRLSIIVSDANQGARKLYERRGYREQARRPMCKCDWSNPGKQWVLLVRALHDGD